ncbi:unnamed protein product [Caenorhabditis auriculariae]|uniref:Adenosine 3'-phospho 5'-phosphosulfate transporter 1 n=1 Tax=Caenorhabditis auriculariae TaxID=2777116 RepID=A0A8S1HKC6_9PELO|nr:unnamed protein product [Caenorhabditis auriculariae]
MESPSPLGRAFDVPARTMSPDEIAWPLRLLLILLGYATVVVPAAFVVVYIRRNSDYFENRSKSLWARWLRLFAVGNPGYELLVEENTQKRKEDRLENKFWHDLFLLLFFFSGIQTTLVMMGFLQERIITLGYPLQSDPDKVDKFGDAQFLIFCNRLVALVFSVFVLSINWKRQPPHVPPLYVHSYTSFSNTLSSWCQYEALKYVSFPTQTICKASKVVVTMLMGRVVRGQKYSWFEYGCGTMIACGASLFLLSSSSHSSAMISTSFSGLLLMIGYLLFDAFTLNWQKALFDTRPRVSKYQMMFGVNAFSGILCLVSLVEQKTLWSSLAFVSLHLGVAQDIFLLSFAGAAGQLFIYATIEKFGPIVFAVIMTIRQMLSIMLSAIYYKHEMSVVALLGFIIVFASIFVDIQKKYFDKRISK